MSAPQQQQPREFEQHAPTAFDAAVVVEACAVQFYGSSPLAIGKPDAMTVPLPILFNVMGQLLVLIASDHPASAALRKMIGEAQQPRVMHTRGNIVAD